MSLCQHPKEQLRIVLQAAHLQEMRNRKGELGQSTSVLVVEFEQKIEQRFRSIMPQPLPRDGTIGLVVILFCQKCQTKLEGPLARRAYLSKFWEKTNNEEEIITTLFRLTYEQIVREFSYSRDDEVDEAIWAMAEKILARQ